MNAMSAILKYVVNSRAYADCDAKHCVIMGDFNCQPNSRFYDSFLQLASNNNLFTTDINRLSNTTTYFSDNGENTSWIDHILCSNAVDKRVGDINILYNFVSSDHKPIVLYLNDITVSAERVIHNHYSNHAESDSVIPDWRKATSNDIQSFQMALDDHLKKINIPITDLDVSPMHTNSRDVIDNYYSSVMSCITAACHSCLPLKRINTLRDYVIPGWNDIVSDKHYAAREAFIAWMFIGKPRQGHEYMLMKRSKAQFKLALRYCKQHEELIRADAYAQNLAAKDYNKFWKSIKNDTHNNATQHAVSVGGCNDDTSITDMWRKHFHDIYNSVNDSGEKFSLEQRLSMTNSDHLNIKLTLREVLEACSKQKSGKAVGLDGIAMEVYLHGPPRLFVHLTALFNLFVQFGYLPSAAMKCLFVPLVKNKTGNLSDVNNYRAIAISTAVSKLLESVLFTYVKSEDPLDAHQFGFTAGLSTGLCTSVFKRTVDYFTHRGSHVFAAFIDFSKAFDRVSYCKLFHLLLDDKVDVNIVQLLFYWYNNQQACVRWRNCLSVFFQIGNGTRQGSLLSPWLFARYIRGILAEIVNSGCGCNVRGVFINILAYADDIVLIAPSWQGLQHLLDLIGTQSANIGMEINIAKSVCMVFAPKNRNRIVSSSFPVFHIGNEYLEFVSTFKYLGHKIVDTASDNDDIMREVRNMFIRTNILLRKFNKCSVTVKTVLFKSFCICLYDAALWTSYTKCTLNKLCSCYTKCAKIFFGYKRRDSTTEMLLSLGIPSFDTILLNASTTFARQWYTCHNS